MIKAQKPCEDCRPDISLAGEGDCSRCGWHQSEHRQFAPSNANTSGLEAKGVVWHNLNGQECIGWTLPKEYFRKEPQAPKPLVTAASAQARIDAAEARADRLAKALERIETEYLLNHTSKWVRETARAALQQETQP